jgi:uncharacterized NAD(P)/FAD-binding protein YdhS
VYCPESYDNRAPVIAVIGGGASGTLAAIHLLRLVAAGRQPVRIALIDAGGRHGLGQAYSTTHPGHLLNSPADTMSAVAGDPGQLLRWATANRIAHDGFLRRSDYGRYLCDTLAESRRQAGPAATVTPVTSQVVRISDRAPRHALRLHLAADGHIDADVAVLAVGSPAAAAPCPVPDSPRYIADPWAPGVLRRIADGKPVMVLGTGLTALDVAIAVTAAHPRAVVHLVSRHALLPRAHRGHPEPGRPAWLPALAGPGGPVRLGELMWQVRTAMADRPEAWEEIMDALRPHVPRLWQRLPVADRRVFLRHVARYWEVHRHRMPPEAARRISVLRGTGRLSVHAGQVRAVTPVPGGLRIRCEHEAGGSPGHEAGWLVNATGPAADITRSGGPLLRDLFGHGLARPDPLRLGLDATPGGAVIDAAGRPSATLFTLGPPLRGLWYETTAIPEIRTQAAALALRLTAAAAATAVPARPGTAA